MARSADAIINPELLVWARESIGLSLEIAAKKIGINEERLTKWERGEERPTVKQLKKAANVYKRPFTVFYLNEPPTDFQALKDYRKLPASERGPHSPELNVDIRKARLRRELALEMIEYLDYNIPTPKLLTEGITRKPEAIAKAIRDDIGISLSEQFDWDDPSKTFKGLRKKIQDKGILVFVTSDISFEEMRGYSISEFPLPVIVINSKDYSYRGRTFTLIHELAHIYLNRGGLCNLEARSTRHQYERETEIRCNEVAGNFLVPTEAFLQEPIISSKGFSVNWNEEEITALSNKYGVSSEVILRRLLELGHTTSEFYQSKRNEFLKAYKQFRDNQKERRKEYTGGPPYATRVAYSLGDFYISMGLESYYSEYITSRDLSDYLGVRLKHIHDIEEKVYQY